jgi:hypothetical protein
MSDQENSARKNQVEERKKLLSEINQRPQIVRVTASSPEIARALVHPKAGKFPKDGGSVGWPLDQFTRRRIAEGAVKVEEEKQQEKRDEKPIGGSRRAGSQAPPVDQPA